MTHFGTARRSLLPPLLVVLGALAPVGGAQTPYGAPTAAFLAGAPRWNDAVPWLGNAAFSFGLREAPGAGTGVLVLSLLPSDFVLGPTRVLIDPDPALWLLFLPVPCDGTLGVPGSGSAQVPVSLATLPPALAGATFYGQWFAEDPVYSGWLAATDGRRFELSLPPQVFVGSSVAGASDPWALVDPLAGVATATGGAGGFGDNVRGAQYAFGGTRLFVSAAIQSKLNVADLSGPTPAISTLYQSPLGYTYGLAFDTWRNRLYTLSGNLAQNRELVCVDADPTSPTYGAWLGQTAGLSGGVGTERVALSADGRVAGVPRLYATAGNDVKFVDTDPASPTYLQTLFSATVPAAGLPGYAIAADCAFTPDGATFVLLISGLGTSVIHRLDMATQTWIDHVPSTPGAEPLFYPSGIASRMAVTRDGTRALVVGTSGSAYLLAFDSPAFPLGTFSAVLPGSGLITGASAPSFTPDGRTAVFASTTPSKVLGVDVATGALAFNVPIGFNAIWSAAR